MNAPDALDPQLQAYVRALEAGEQPDSGISERAFERWMTEDPLALAIISGDKERILALADGQPDYIKERIAAYVTGSSETLAPSPAQLRNAARRLAIKQAKRRNT